MRTSAATLRFLVALLAEQTRLPLELDHDATGWRLDRQHGPGIDHVSPRLSAGQMEDYLRAWQDCLSELSRRPEEPRK